MSHCINVYVLLSISKAKCTFSYLSLIFCTSDFNHTMQFTEKIDIFI